MNVTGSIVNKNTTTIFVAAFIATLMAVFTAAAVMPDDQSVLAHQQPASSAAAADEESEFGSCTDPKAKSAGASTRANNTVVKKVVHKTTHTNSGSKPIVDVDADVEDLVDVEVSDVIDVNDVVDINDNNIPILSKNNILSNTLNNNKIDLGLDVLNGLL